MHRVATLLLQLHPRQNPAGLFVVHDGSQCAPQCLCPVRSPLLDVLLKPGDHFVGRFAESAPLCVAVLVPVVSHPLWVHPLQEVGPLLAVHGPDEIELTRTLHRLLIQDVEVEHGFLSVCRGECAHGHHPLHARRLGHLHEQRAREILQPSLSEARLENVPLGSEDAAGPAEERLQRLRQTQRMVQTHTLLQLLQPPQLVAISRLGSRVNPRKLSVFGESAQLGHRQRRPHAPPLWLRRGGAPWVAHNGPGCELRVAGCGRVVVSSMSAAGDAVARPPGHR
mmetsp:Transcript_50529/g.126624  ORF Transcript_50529/g.126624 Transcript_50529/m.126624 type:complete len:281 (+) Transcript_50529:3009-3851(+)